MKRKIIFICFVLFALIAVTFSEHSPLSNFTQSTSKNQASEKLDATNELGVSIVDESQKNSDGKKLEAIALSSEANQENPNKLDTVDLEFFSQAGEKLPAAQIFERDGSVRTVISKNITSLDETPLNNNEEIIIAHVNNGETISTILNKYISQAEIYEAIDISKDIHELERITASAPYSITLNEDKQLIRFEYERNKSEIFVLNAEPVVAVNEAGEEKVDYNFTASISPIIYDIELAHITAEIDISLSGALDALGERASLTPTIVNILAYQVDFFRDIQKGDVFEVLAEKKYRDGEFVSYGDILAVSYTNKNKTYSAYHYEMEGTSQSYYDGNGEALEKLLLKSPLDYTRISSGYTMARRHPILGTVRPHQGIDYAAPSGTPVRTVGDGTVTFVGTQGGYGKLIIMKHSNGLESMYAHLSRYDKKTKKGAFIERGEIIGYVGSTGLSTGPHLDFRIKENGKFVNPDSIIVPQSPPLEGEHKDKFLVQVASIKDYMNGTIMLSQYVPKEKEEE